jgi:hypothetical protein
VKVGESLGLGKRSLFQINIEILGSGAFAGSSINDFDGEVSGRIYV